MVEISLFLMSFLYVFSGAVDIVESHFVARIKCDPDLQICHVFKNLHGSRMPVRQGDNGYGGRIFLVEAHERVLFRFTLLRGI